MRDAKIILVLVFILWCASVVFGQHASAPADSVVGRYTSVLVGYNGAKRQFLEAGVSISKINVIDGHHVAGTTAFVSTEVMVDKNPTIGPKIGIWGAGGAFCIGANAIYYINRNESSLRLRPEAGIGMSLFKFVYGYNFAITNKDFNRLNKHSFSLVVNLKIKTLKNKPSLL